MKLGIFLYNTVASCRVLLRVTLTTVSTFYYRFVCAEFGTNSKVRWGTWIRYPQNVHIGDNVFISENVSIGSELKDSRLLIASSVQINKGVAIDYTGCLSIGEKTLIAEGAIIYSHSHNLDPFSKPRPIAKEIGDNCWLGVRSIVLENVSSINAFAIVGAGAVVTKSIDTPGIYGGVPAKFIRPFPEESANEENDTLHASAYAVP